MYEDTILPVRSKFRVPSRSQTRIYFVQDKTKESLLCIKWIELVTCLLCLCFAIVSINTISEIPTLEKILIISSNSSGILIVLAEITYPFLKKSLPIILQVLGSGVCFSLFSLVAAMIYQIDLRHDLLKAILFLNGSSAVIFLVDFLCRILISTYLYQTTRVRRVVDVGVTAFFPPPTTSSKPKSHPHRSVLTATPITYGGTFPIGKNQPPFLAEERSPPNDLCYTSEKGIRTKNTQTQLTENCFYLGSNSTERLTRSAVVQTYLEQNERGTFTELPFYSEEERRKKSPWTCSTPTNSRKFDARKQASMSTPITYSGTFAVNKELVPFTPGTLSDTSPKTSPRTLSHSKPHRKHKDITSSRSEGHSPVRTENIFLELDKLDHISEEKISQISSENSSLKKSNYAFFDSSILPGSVGMENEQEYKKNYNYFVS